MVLCWYVPSFRKVATKNLPSDLAQLGQAVNEELEKREPTFDDRAKLKSEKIVKDADSEIMNKCKQSLSSVLGAQDVKMTSKVVTYKVSTFEKKTEFYC